MKVLCSILLLALLGTAVSVADARPVPTWDKKIDGKARFQVLSAFADAAVLDKETGLVWERSPSADDFTWAFATYHCDTLVVGNRAGWRLPGISEILSLVDPSAAPPGPTLPAVNPFSNVQTVATVEHPSIFYWTASSGPFVPGATSAFEMNFAFATASVTTTDKSVENHAWCVRGGTAVDPQT